MSDPISSATEEKTSAGKFNTETIIPEIALSKIFKKDISEIRSRILKLRVR